MYIFIIFFIVSNMGGWIQVKMERGRWHLMGEKISHIWSFFDMLRNQSN